MIMMNRISKNILLIVALVSLFSCKKDDNSTSFYVVPYAEQAPIDDEALVEFLTTHYYNEEQFVTPGNYPNFNYDIEFFIDETLAQVDANGDDDFDDTNQVVDGYTRTALIDLVETEVVIVDDVEHNLYILRARDGSGVGQPKFCDSTFLDYKGMQLDKIPFDSSVNPRWLDLTSTVKGFTESVSAGFYISTGNTSNNDGTYTFNDYGVGAAFMPSGLGYYANPPLTIETYAPLIFTFKVFNAVLDTDHDNDGIPTFLEDLNGDEDLFNDDTDNDTSPNYLDTNDDGDPILTKDEVVTNTYVINEGDVEPVLGLNEYEVKRVTNETVVPNQITITTSTYIDSDNDGILDYLDSDS
jgi:hypothetical protein